MVSGKIKILNMIRKKKKSKQDLIMIVVDLNRSGVAGSLCSVVGCTVRYFLGGR